jgi:hypothetical protein
MFIIRSPMAQIMGTQLEKLVFLSPGENGRVEEALEHFREKGNKIDDHGLDKGKWKIGLEKLGKDLARLFYSDC